MSEMPRRASQLADREPNLPEPLEEQLESIVEEVLGDDPLARPEPELLDAGNEFAPYRRHRPWCRDADGHHA